VDARQSLTDNGVLQCKTAREDWGKRVFDEAELIVVSPMTRALQTAFNINGQACDERWLLSHMCSEKLSGATCDEGTPKSEQLGKLPWVKEIRGFDELAEEWWTEKREEEELRVASFLDVLMKRPEKKIVVVSHGAFLGYIVGFHLHNVEKFLMPLAELRNSKEKMQKPAFNLNNALIKEYEGKPLKTIANAPLNALQGIGRKKAALLAQVGPKTVKALASWKFARWAEALCILEPLGEEGARDFCHMKETMNINKAFDSEWEGYSITELLDAPLSAFEGLTEKQDATFQSIGLKTIRDLGTWKYYAWARAVCTLSETETEDGSS